MEIDWVKLINESLRIVASLLAGLVLAYCGLRIYFRQKEHELVKQRYLDQCLDVVAGELEEITSVLLNNWARSLELVKELRDSPGNFERNHLDQGFLPLRGSNFNHAAHHRLKILIKSQIVWNCYQLALSRHMALNGVAAKEIPHALSEYISGRLPNASSEEIAEASFEQLQPMVNKSNEFVLLQDAIQRIAEHFERSRLSFKDVERFAELDSVRLIVKELEDHYTPMLTKTEEEYVD